MRHIGMEVVFLHGSLAGNRIARFPLKFALQYRHRRGV